MENKTKFEFLTPSKTVIQEDVEMVVLPGSEGYFGVLHLHAPTLSSLNQGIISLYEKNKITKKIIIDGGIADVQPEGCVVLSEKAETTDDLDKKKIEEQLKVSNEKLSASNIDSEKDSHSKEISWLKFILENIE